jgi:preprotein translocase subunit SecD
MSVFPRWKTILVVVVLLLGTLLALPNVYGEAPALQLSRKDRAAFTEASVAEYTALLAQAGVTPEAGYVESGRLLLRLKDVPSQLRAKAAVEAAQPNQFAIATTFASRMPAWLRGLGLRAMPLGLDLRGGIYLVVRHFPEKPSLKLNQLASFGRPLYRFCECPSLFFCLFRRATLGQVPCEPSDGSHKPHIHRDRLEVPA